MIGTGTLGQTSSVDALKKGLSTCLVRTVDTDVIVILIGIIPYLIIVNSDANIWVAFGVGKTCFLAYKHCLF